MARENIQDQLCAVDNAALGELFNVALLDGRKIAVENNELCLMGVGFRANFVQLATSHQRGGVGGIAHLKNGGDNGGAGAGGQFDQFEEGFASLFARGHARETRGALPANADEECSFGVRYLLW